LYNIIAYSSPQDNEGTHIADLVLQSTLTTSYWGDKYMFVKHQNMVEDLIYHPEWTSAVPTLPSILSEASCPYMELQKKAKALLGF